jgi:hypothetical protein
VNKFIALSFFSRLSMMKEKVKLILRKRRHNVNLRMHWIDRFLIKHSEYRAKFSRHFYQERHFNFNRDVFQKWFELFQKTCQKYDIVCENIYNMNKELYDENKWQNKMSSSFQLNLMWTSLNSIWQNYLALILHVKKFFSKIIVRRNMKNVFFVHSENRKWMTTIKLMSTRDRVFRSLMIFSKKIIQKAWTNTWSYSMYEVFINEWIDNELVLSWLKKLFHLETAHIDDRRLLIINNYQFHVFVEFVKFYWKMKIVSLCLSFHTTHYLQSFDVDCFASLNKTYKKKVEKKKQNKCNAYNQIRFSWFSWKSETRYYDWSNHYVEICENRYDSLNDISICEQFVNKFKFLFWWFVSSSKSIDNFWLAF